ncbi:MAG TPA: hypothetical protein DCY27_08095 [Desulfobacterales bacterium]|nr:hypothetical protein [Desulfobacterales bacterium]
MSFYQKLKFFFALHGLPMCAAAFLTTAAWIYLPVRHFCLENRGAKIGDWLVWAIVGWEWQWLLSALAAAAIITTAIPRAMARRQPEIIKLRQKIYERDQDMAARQKDLDNRAADLDHHQNDLETRYAAMQEYEQQLSQQAKHLHRREAEFFETQRNSENAKAEAEAQTQQTDALIQSAQNRAAEIIKHAQAEAMKIINDAKAQAELFVRRVAERQADYPQTQILSSGEDASPPPGPAQPEGVGDDNTKRKEIMKYFNLIKSMREVQGLTWRKISKHLNQQYQLKTNYSFLYKVWQEETDKK